MIQKERQFKKEYASELAKIAEQDLLSATVLAKDQRVRKENVIFHAQQCVEKSIKAYLCFKSSAIPLTHDLFAILQKMQPDELPPGGYDLDDLTPFASIRRYEEGVMIITAQDVEQAIEQADNVLKWLHNHLSKK